MPDFRMNKKKPIGKRTLNTIAGINTGRRLKPAPESVPTPPSTKPVFETTPDLREETVPMSKVSASAALGLVLTKEEITDEPVTQSVDSSPRSDTEARSDDSDDKLPTTDPVAEEGSESSESVVDTTTAEVEEVGSDISNDYKAVVETDNGDTGPEVEKPASKTEVETADSKVKEAEADGVVKEGIEVPADGKERTTKLTGTKPKRKTNASKKSK